MITALIIGMGALALVGGLIWIANNSGKGMAVAHDAANDVSTMSGVQPSSDSRLGHHRLPDGTGDGGDTSSGDSGGGGD